MTLDIGQEKEFEYNEDISYDLNFDRWYRWNCDERRYNKEKILSKKDARERFNKLYGAYFLKDI